MLVLKIIEFRVGRLCWKEDMPEKSQLTFDEELLRYAQ